MAVHPIHKCRVCGCKNLIPIIDLGKLAVSDFVLNSKKVKKSSLSLVLCDPKTGCGLVQLGSTGVDQDLLYRQYWYKSGVNQSMKRALKDVARDSQRRISLKKGDIVMDIGANDGTLLSFFPQSLTRVGVEPALNIQTELQSYSSVNVPEYFSKKAYRKYVGATPAKLITSLAMYYDLDDPISFTKDLKNVLAPDGIWINQMTYLGDMLEKNDYPNICHEHVTYYSLHTFLEVLKRTGLKLIDVTRNDVNGGSIRTVVTHIDAHIESPRRQGYAGQASDQAKARIQALLDWEALHGLQKRSTYRQFAAQVRKSKRELKTLISKYKKAGESIYVYGASTKGNTLLQYCGLSYPLISGAFDRNPEKAGRYTVATQIPIYLESEMKRLKPNVLLVLPWHFKEEFLKREKTFLEQGGVMVFPLPDIEVASSM